MSVRSSKSVRTRRPKTKSVETLPRNKGRDSRRDPYNLAMRRSAFLQCLAGSALYAQQPAPISVAVNEVIVPITVTDEKGRFVSDLKQEDFKIYDEGKLQKISYFSRERNQPVVVGFLLDLSNASRLHWKNYQDSAIELALALIPDNDKRFSGYLITYGNEAELAVNTTQDAAKITEKNQQAQAGRRGGALRRHLHRLHLAQPGEG